MKAGSIDEDEDPRADTKLPLPGDVPSSNTGRGHSTHSQQSENSTLNVPGLKGQIRLTELLKVIAHKRMAKGTLTTAHHQQEAIAGPSVPTLCSSLRPLRKAKYSWQVKNNMEQKGQMSANPAEDAGLLVERNEKVSYVTDVGASNEPPPKKVKVNTDDDSAETYTKQRTSDDNHFNHPAALKGDDNSLQSETRVFDISTSVLGQSRKVSETHMEKNKSQRSDPVKAFTAPSTPSHTGQQTGVFARWQGRHVAQSIVDNAINATLEVLGFSFDSDTRTPSQTVSAAQRQHLEDDAVSAVIQAHGLQGTESVVAVDGNRIRSNLLQNNVEQRIHSQGELADSSHTRIPQAIRASLLRPQATRSSLLDTEATGSSLMDAEATRSSLLDAEATKSSLLDAEATRSSLLDVGATRSSLLDVGATRSSLLDAGATRSSLLDAEAIRLSFLDAEASRSSLLNSEASRSSLLDTEATRSSLLDAGASMSSLLHAEVTRSSLLDIGASKSSLLDAEVTRSSLLDAGASRSSLLDAEVTRSSLLDPQGRRSSLMEPILNHLRHHPRSLVAVPDSAVSPVSISNQPILAGGTRRERSSGKEFDDYEELDTLFPPALQTDVLNKAVSAAISQKGLAMDGAL